MFATPSTQAPNQPPTTEPPNRPLTPPPFLLLSSFLPPPPPLPPHSSPSPSPPLPSPSAPSTQIKKLKTPKLMSLSAVQFGSHCKEITTQSTSTRLNCWIFGIRRTLSHCERLELWPDITRCPDQAPSHCSHDDHHRLPYLYISLTSSSLSSSGTGSQPRCRHGS